MRVALKFIPFDEHKVGPELRALEAIRDIRHPHLLDVQFAVRAGEFLVIAMPLCEQSLWDRLSACQKQGCIGVPPDELLGYMDELARAGWPTSGWPRCSRRWSPTTRRATRRSTWRRSCSAGRSRTGPTNTRWP